MMQRYRALEDEYGGDALALAMAVTAGDPDDEQLLPIDRYARTAALLQSRKDDLRDSLREVEAALGGDAGAHRDILERLRTRLTAFIARDGLPF
jgi:hypothetical protein